MGVRGHGVDRSLVGLDWVIRLGRAIDGRELFSALSRRRKTVHGLSIRI